LAPDAPDYATQSYFDRNYGQDIQLVTRYIDEQGQGYDDVALKGKLHPDIVAVIEVREDADEFGDDEYHDLLGQYEIAKDGFHSLNNGIGIAEITVDNVDQEMLIRTIEVDDQEYWIAIRPREELK